MRSPSRLRTAGRSVSAATTETMPTRIAPVARLRMIVFGTSSRPVIARTNAAPLKSTARLAVAPGGLDGVQLLASLCTLLPKAAEDEEASSRSRARAPFRRSCSSTKTESSNTWPTIAVSASATTIERSASTSGMTPATTVPKTSSRTISAAGAPKKSSPFCRSSSESVAEVLVDRELSRHRRLDVRLLVEALGPPSTRLRRPSSLRPSPTRSAVAFPSAESSRSSPSSAEVTTVAAPACRSSSASD